MTINYNNKTIEMTKAFANKARRYGSEEYNALCDAQRSFPTYKLVMKAPSVKKNELKGLTYDFMRKYIETHNKDLLDAFAELTDSSAADGDIKLARSYGEVKKWFLKNFPQIGAYHTNTNAILANV